MASQHFIDGASTPPVPGGESIFPVPGVTIIPQREVMRDVSRRNPVVEHEIYRIRFNDKELQQQREYWLPICRFLENYMKRRGRDPGPGCRVLSLHQ